MKIMSTEEKSFLTGFAGELHRISVCYGSGKGDEDTYTFSDDQSSCQVTLLLQPVREAHEEVVDVHCVVSAG